MKLKRVLMFLVLIVILLAASITAPKPPKPDDPPEPETPSYDCYTWRMNNYCEYYIDSGWNIKEYRKDVDNDGREALQECYEGTKPADMDIPTVGVILGIDSDMDTLVENPNNVEPEPCPTFQKAEASMGLDEGWPIPPKEAQIKAVSQGFASERIFASQSTHPNPLGYTLDQEQTILDCINERSELPEYGSIAEIVAVLEGEYSSNYIALEKQLASAWTGFCMGFVCPKCGVTVSEFPEAATFMDVIIIGQDMLNNGASNDELKEAANVLKKLNNYENFATEYDVKPGAVVCYECSSTPAFIDLTAGSATTASTSTTVTGYATDSTAEAETTSEETSLWDSFINWISAIF